MTDPRKEEMFSVPLSSDSDTGTWSGNTELCVRNNRFGILTRAVLLCNALLLLHHQTRNYSKAQ